MPADWLQTTRWPNGDRPPQDHHFRLFPNRTEALKQPHRAELPAALHESVRGLSVGAPVLRIQVGEVTAIHPDFNSAPTKSWNLSSEVASSGAHAGPATARAIRRFGKDAGDKDTPLSTN